MSGVQRYSECGLHAALPLCSRWRVNAGVTSPAEFFSEDNLGRIFAAAR